MVRTVRKKKTPTDKCKPFVDAAVLAVKTELIPRIDEIDRRDKEQYDFAKKIIQDMSAALSHRTKSVEDTVSLMKAELDEIFLARKQMTDQLTGTMNDLHLKIDTHITDESGEFQKIHAALSQIRVNGGVYPLNEALKHIYDKNVETHQKLDEVAALVEPIAARKKWITASKELIKKNGLLHFVFTTRIGAIVGTVTVLLIVNTVAKDVFNINLDIVSLIKWIGSLVKGG